MASGTLVEEGKGCRDDVVPTITIVREGKNRWIENRVYRRKVFKKKKQQPSPPPQTTTVASGEGGDKEVAVAVLPEATENGPSVQTTENHVNIHLSAMSKEEIREVKQKLVDELEQVRDLLKQVEAKEVQLNDVDGCASVEVGVKEVQIDVGAGLVDVDVVEEDDVVDVDVDVMGDDVVDVDVVGDDVVDVDVVGEDIVEVDVMGIDINAYSRRHSHFSGSDVLDNGGGRRLIPEVDLDNGGGARRMFPEFSLENSSGRRMISGVSWDNGGERRMMSESEVHFDNGGGARRMSTDFSLLGKREPPRSYNQVRVSVMENSHSGLTDYVDKEKRTPKANPFYRNSDFIVGKERLPPPNKKPKLHGSKKHGRGGERDFGFGLIKHTSQVFKSCNSLLAKLMKHKHGWVFNTPVDAERLGLHDYFNIIKYPMDLGTVKTRLNTDWYRSPREFGADVRLTFSNAMTYNPKGQDVHVMAEQLSHMFEDRWVVMENEYILDSWRELYHHVGLPTPTMNRASLFPPPDMGRHLDRLPSTPRPVKTKSVNRGSSGRTAALKKPKAKDMYKRDMTYEEKQKLSKHLQGLPSEKLDNIVEIIQRRNESLVHRDDEIEVDIDSVDNETLWELDRFVTNYKKSLSKYKRRAELAMQAREQAERNAQERNQAPAMVVEVSKETKLDEKNTGVPPPLQEGKEQENSSGSSSSSSSSSDSGSSSSDSDSDSSSGSDAANSPKA